MRIVPASARRVAALMVLALLSGCAAQRGRELPTMPDWQTRNTVLGRTTRWEFSGRIGVSAGDEGFNGKLWWWQRDDRFRATVSGPLGVGTVRIDGEENRIRLTDKDGAVTELDDPEHDLRRIYGWTIPVASLRYWALGIPDPAIPADIVFDEAGLPSSLQQRSWIVSIDQYRDGAGQPMPRRISAINGDAKVRLVIDSWIIY